MLYTGGTTGMPKGVMYRIGDHTSLFLSLGYSAVGLTPPADPSEVPGLVRQITDAGTRMISVPTAPLMHGTGLWLGCFVAHLAGGAVVTLAGRSLDGHEVLRTAQDNRAVLLVLVGDAMTKPLIKAFDEASERGRAVRPVAAQDDHLVGCDVDDRGERATPRPGPPADADRRHRIDRGLDRQPGHDARRRHRDRQVRPGTRPPRSSPRTGAT